MPGPSSQAQVGSEPCQGEQPNEQGKQPGKGLSPSFPHPTGIHDTLLINSKHAGKKVTNLETVRIPRSNILDRVQSFLPQMALANNELRREMATAPAHQFDIENLDSCLENIIEMNVALVELSGSDTDEEEIISEDSSESEEDSCATDEVTIDTIKLPKQKGEKGKIEILDSKVNE
ncbi:NOP protein chaperone 1 isoform X1 [Mauremys mutica]|uniref:NOP protein chaperone 1 isoform X1 n=1 Tax=Mauremys mutica TaxID=74926 RepID=UPI001D14812E|nr:NOP protein chaperone 1 isoform X1 [Mauremys mutica]